MNDTQPNMIQLIILRISGVILSVIGYFFAAAVVIGLLGGALNDHDSAIGVLIVLVLAIAGIFFGRKVKKMIIRYKKYMSIIDDQIVVPLDSLAEITQQPLQLVKKDIRALINMRVYEDAFLEEQFNYLYPWGYIEIAEDLETAADESSETIVVSCKNCGANNTVRKGKTSKCEYCGSALNE